MIENDNQGTPNERPADEDGGGDPAIIPPNSHSTTDAEAAQPQEPEPGELDRRELRGIVEALLFAAETPLSAARIAGVIRSGNARLVRGIIEELRAEYDTRGSAFSVEELAGGYRVLTRPEFHTWVRRLRQREQEDTLSQAALETLAIVAYRQPITRADIEDIRGVQSGYILRSLIEKSLVRVVGRTEELGRPLLYGTSGKFLDAFGLASLRDLPKLDELERPEDAK